MEEHFLHFNAREALEAARAFEAHLDAGGKMMVTLAGAMSTAELGVSLSRLILGGKVHAISCTGVGEHFIRSGGALAIACDLRAGTPLDDAIARLLAEVRRLGGDGGVIAVTRDGAISMAYNSQGMKRAALGSDAALVSTTF